MALDSKIPKGPLADKWTKHKSKINLSKSCKQDVSLTL